MARPVDTPELARKREAELHKDERTTPLNKEQ